MSLDRRYLELCQRLQRQGLECAFTPGMQIARGFADLGHELFTVLAEGQILSNFTGAKSLLTEAERNFFFWIPSADELVDCIQRSEFNLLDLRFQDQRHWLVRIEHITKKEEFEFKALSLCLGLGEALMHCLRK